MTTSELAPIAATTASATTSDSPPPLPQECGMTTVDIKPEHTVVITPVDVPVAHSPAFECCSASALPSFASSSLKPYHFHGLHHWPSSINTNVAADIKLDTITEESRLDDELPHTRAPNEEELSLGFSQHIVYDDAAHCQWLHLARHKHEQEIEEKYSKKKKKKEFEQGLCHVM